MRSNVAPLRTDKKSEAVFQRRVALPTAWRSWAMAVSLAAAFFFAYADVFEQLLVQWSSLQMYSYGFLIPWISFYLIWTDRNKLSNLQMVPEYVAGGTVLALGLFMLLAGRLASVLALEQFSLIVSIAGLVLFVLGKRFLRVLSIPIAYLLFMIPVWGILLDRLHLPFQIFSATLGISLLHYLGVPAYRHELFIDLPNMTLEVAQVCSGVNYLLAIVAIGIPLAHLFIRGWFRRTVLVCFAVIIAILSNGLRVALIGALVYFGIGTNVHGPMHVLQGLFVSAIGYAALFLGLWVLTKSSPTSDSASVPSAGFAASGVFNKQAVISVVAVASLAFVALGAYLRLYQPIPVPLKRELNSFPLTIANWTAAGTPAELPVYSNSDHEFHRIYHNDSGESLQLYVGYYSFQEQGRELISERTAELDRQASPVAVTLSPGVAIQVNRLIQRVNGRSRLILFWYDLNGRVVADRWLAKAHTAWDGLTRWRSNAAIVVVSSDVDSPEDLPRKFAVGQAFIGRIWPVLHDYLP
jgi:EpsI family protein